jgi:hypothetical protein
MRSLVAPENLRELRAIVAKLEHSAPDKARRLQRTVQWLDDLAFVVLLVVTTTLCCHLTCL